MPTHIILLIVLAGFLGVLYLISLLFTAAIKRAERRKIRLDQLDNYD